jgi:hypothetical protein
MTIQIPIDYVTVFGLVAVYITTTETGLCGFGVGQPPADAAACWWATSVDGAESTLDMLMLCDLRQATRHGDLIAVTVEQASASVEAAARRAQVTLLPHALILDRAAGVVRGVELRQFQKTYRARRLAAGGLPFPSYSLALRRLQAALSSTLAGTKLDRATMKSVFEGRPDEAGRADRVQARIGQARPAQEG